MHMYIHIYVYMHMYIHIYISTYTYLHTYTWLLDHMVTVLIVFKEPPYRSLGNFPCGSAGKESACSAGDLGLIPGVGRFPGEGYGNPFQYSGLENSMDCIVHGVAKSRTRLSDFSLSLFTFHTILHSSYTNLHSCWQCRRVLFSSHPV